MKKIEITIRDIKEIKKLMIEVDKIKEDNCHVDGYSYNYNGQEAMIEFKQAAIQRNIEIAAQILKVSCNVIVDMCYDFEFAEYVLADIENSKNITVENLAVDQSNKRLVELLSDLKEQKTGTRIDLVLAAVNNDLALFDNILDSIDLARSTRVVEHMLKDLGHDEYVQSSKFKPFGEVSDYLFNQITKTFYIAVVDQKEAA